MNCKDTAWHGVSSPRKFNKVAPLEQTSFRKWMGFLFMNMMISTLSHTNHTLQLSLSLSLRLSSGKWLRNNSKLHANAVQQKRKSPLRFTTKVCRLRHQGWKKERIQGRTHALSMSKVTHNSYIRHRNSMCARSILICWIQAARD